MTIFPGLLPIVGFVAFLARRQPLRLPLAAAAAVAWVLCLGPSLKIGGTFVWRRPWMTLSATTYGSSLLDLVGFDNLFAAASDRYAEVTLEEVAGRRPAFALLPSEPYAFGPADLSAFDGYPEMPAVRHGRIRLVDGSLLTWPGTRLGQALEVLPGVIAQAL